MLSIGDAVVGEAACLAMGMLMMGSRSRSTMSELIAQCEQMEHEKVARGASVGIALLCFDHRDGCKKVITLLQRSQNVFMRRAAMYAIAMAWIGSGHSQAIRTLLHFAVSDVSDDVRRAAVEAMGFVMHRQPADKILATISLLNESYNPHVRYASAMALGIALAGSGNADAIKLIEPLAQDPVTFVRLGSYIGQAMIVGDLAEAACPQTKSVRLMLSRVIQDKHEDLMAKWGAIVAQGIIDACGRNASISLSSISQPELNCPMGAAGCLLFLHFWFWFPTAHMLSLAFRPSALILVDENLQPPEIELLSGLSPSYFAYPTTLLEAQRRGDKSGTAGDKLEAAVLSIRRQRGAAATAGSSKVSGGTGVRSKSSNKESTPHASKHPAGEGLKSKKEGKISKVIETATDNEDTAGKSNTGESPAKKSVKKSMVTIESPDKEIKLTGEDLSPRRKSSIPSDAPITPTSPSIEKSPRTDTQRLAEAAPQMPQGNLTPTRSEGAQLPPQSEVTSAQGSRDAPKKGESTQQVAVDDTSKVSTRSSTRVQPSTSIVVTGSVCKDNLASTPQSPPIIERKRNTGSKTAGALTTTTHADSRRHHRSTKLRNLAVVRRGYEYSIGYPSAGRFQPAYMFMKCGTAQSQPLRRGIIVVIDTKPEAGSYRMMRMMKSTALPKEDAQKEPDAPEPFDYVEEAPASSAPPPTTSA